MAHRFFGDRVDAIQGVSIGRSAVEMATKEFDEIFGHG